MPVSVLLLTNPDNPTGRIMAEEDLVGVVEWARSRGLYLVVNEIYALSVHGDRGFPPGGSLIGDVGMDVHEVWGFSEDFAMSGLRCGVLTSKNDDLLAAVGELAYRSVVSGDTQHLLAGEAWVTTYLVELRARLKHSYEVTTTALEAVPAFLTSMATQGSSCSSTCARSWRSSPGKLRTISGAESSRART